MRIGIADHLGWAVVVAADDDHEVIDRRRIALVEPSLTDAPIHYEGKNLSVPEVEALVSAVRASAVATAGAALDGLVDELGAAPAVVSIREWPADFPTDIETLLRSPWEARADGVIYRRVLDDVIRTRGWDVHTYDHRTVIASATERLGDRAEAVLVGPRKRLGPPWAKDHRLALAATVMSVV